MSKRLAGEKHLRGPKGWYAYCGPGTQYEKRINSNDAKLRLPINKLDAFCKKHDGDYNRIQKSYDTHTKDELKKMVREADERFIKNLETVEKGLDKFIVKGAMLSKMKAENIGFLNKLKFVPRTKNEKPRADKFKLLPKETGTTPSAPRGSKGGDYAPFKEEEKEEEQGILDTGTPSQ